MFQGLQPAPIDAGKPPVKSTWLILKEGRAEQERSLAKLSRGAAPLSCNVEGECLVTC